MIKFEYTETVGWEAAIRGMRNPMNSWEKSDTQRFEDYDVNLLKYSSLLDIGPNDAELMMKLRKAGTDHRKFMRMIAVYVDITAPLYWWKEYDTYKVGTVANSCSTMHKIHEKEFTLEDFSTEHLLGGLNHYDEREVPYLDFSPERDNSITYSSAGIFTCCIIPMLNLCREKYLQCETTLRSNATYGIDPEKSISNIKKLQKQYWLQMIQLLPSSYNQKRTLMLNYEVLANIYHSRKNHKLDEWKNFCKWIESLPYSEIITGEIGNAEGCDGEWEVKESED